MTQFSKHEHLVSLLEASPVPTAIYTGSDITIRLANQPMLDLWDKDRSVIGKTFESALPELQQQPFFELLKEVYASGQTFQTKEARADLLREGELQPFYFDFSYKAIPGSDGKTSYIIHTAVDITQLVEAKKKLQSTQEWLTLSLSSAGIGTWDLNPLENKVHWDARCKELFGYSGEDDVAYADVLGCIYPDDEVIVRSAVRKALDHQSDGYYDIRYRTKSKKGNVLRWLHCRGKAYFNAEGKAFRFAGTAIDITNEVAVRRREHQLLSLMENNLDHMTIADMDGNLTYMNLAAKKMLGVKDGVDITTLQAKDFYTPEELERVQGTLIKQISEKSGWQGIINIMNMTTKESFPCQVNYQLIRDPQSGEVIGRGATVRDLRPEIKAKAEIRRLAKLIDISEDFCNYCDLTGQTLYLNGSGLKLIGLTEEEVGKSNMFAYHSPDSSLLIKEEIIPKLLSDGKWSGELELVHQKTGEVIQIHKQLFVIRDEITNEPVAFAGIARDLRPELNFMKVLDDKNAALQNTIEELEFLANSVPSVVWTSKPDGMLDYINQRWQEHGNGPKESALGAGWAATLHPDDLQAAWASWNESLSTGSPYQVEFRLKNKSGGYRWWLARAVALKNNKGEIIKWYGTNTDITDHKELQGQKDNFLGVASHELKTPITSIKAYAQVMQTIFNNSGDMKNGEMVGKMLRQVNRLNSLVEDLLNVTKINTGRLQFNYEEFDFNQMVEEVTEDVQRTSNKHLIKKQLKYRRMLSGDKDRICQVVTNLLTNAIKYSPDANEIVIYTEDHGTEVQLCVQDFGIGISPGKKDKVFEQFYRVSGSKEYTFPGLGLGLYISSEIVKRLGGRIWVTSVEGKGSTFCFSIPVQQTFFQE